MTNNSALRCKSKLEIAARKCAAEIVAMSRDASGGKPGTVTKLPAAEKSDQLSAQQAAVRFGFGLKASGLIAER
jgi:hypothetical protein